MSRVDFCRTTVTTAADVSVFLVHRLLVFFIPLWHQADPHQLPLVTRCGAWPDCNRAPSRPHLIIPKSHLIGNSKVTSHRDSGHEHWLGGNYTWRLFYCLYKIRRIVCFIQNTWINFFIKYFKSFPRFVKQIEFQSVKCCSKLYANLA